jgi:hypothetical protein
MTRKLATLILAVFVMLLPWIGAWKLSALMLSNGFSWFAVVGTLIGAGVAGPPLLGGVFGVLMILFEVITARNLSPATSDKLDPPMLAEFLLTAVATSSRAEAAVGDLNERFADECQKFGRRRAVRLYWARTLRSLWPLLVRAIGKALKWGAVIATTRWYL